MRYTLGIPATSQMLDLNIRNEMKGNFKYSGSKYTNVALADK